MPHTPKQIDAEKARSATGSQMLGQVYELLKEVEFVELNGVRFCPCCNNCWGLPKHEPDCKLAALLKAVEGEERC